MRWPPLRIKIKHYTVTCNTGLMIWPVPTTPSTLIFLVYTPAAPSLSSSKILITLLPNSSDWLFSLLPYLQAWLLRVTQLPARMCKSPQGDSTYSRLSPTNTQVTQLYFHHTAYHRLKLYGYFVYLFMGFHPLTYKLLE